MEVHRGVLSLLDIEELFRISLGVLVQLQIPVAEGDKGEPHLVKIPHAIVGNVPPQHVVPDFVVFVPLLCPLLRRESTEGGQGKAVLPHHLLHLSQSGVDLTALHNNNLLAEPRLSP